MPIKNSITVIGLGYVGLPLLIELKKNLMLKDMIMIFKDKIY